MRTIAIRKMFGGKPHDGDGYQVILPAEELSVAELAEKIYLQWLMTPPQGGDTAQFAYSAWKAARLFFEMEKAQ